MLKTLLIANRGEIAVRIMRTARKMGLRTIAVYSDVDAGALHVRSADVAVQIGGAAPADSYLRGDRIIEAALAHGADAIHPGYGFLSENPDFVEAVAAAGLAFVGPSAEAIRTMGLKDRAKSVMQKAGVPVVPGYQGKDQSDATLQAEAKKIGAPLMIKAVAGGGGKGMRRVDDLSAFDSALASARAEARTAFGNDAVLLERFVANPRHIEVQVFGDGQNAVHLYERDCSLQRRYQKVIEEAPAPGMTDDVRQAMGQAAVQAARAIGYSGAGTVEFIVDGSGPLRDDGFWFMEMNTRLQVEHPVTEAVTGLDLVEWQLRVAAGEPLPLAQDDITLTGHAIEARLYAEDVQAGFLPATGTVSHLKWADEIRPDSAVEAGDVVSPHYDPMIAKMIVHGPSREAARVALLRGLAETELAGITTNQGFLFSLLSHDGFAAGDVDIGLIDRDLEALTALPEPSPRDYAQAALRLCGMDQMGSLGGFVLHTSLRWRVEMGGVEVVLTPSGPDHVRCEIDGAVVDALRSGGGWTFNGHTARLDHLSDRTITLFGTPPLTLFCPDPLDRTSEDMAGDTIYSPMPGLLREVLVVPGETVEKGQRLAVMEAMKMEHVLTSPRNGAVASVGAAAGGQVGAGLPLIVLEPIE